jgi:hypothetical protein
MLHPLRPCLILLSSLAALPLHSADSQTPLYTNEDLERVAPFRDQTGVASVPAVAPADDAPQDAKRPRKGTQGQQAREEAYWRREAARHRKRQEALIDKADRVRQQIAEEKIRRRHSLQMRDAAILERLEERLASVEKQRIDEDDRFFERARRAGALPGWLR